MTVFKCLWIVLSYIDVEILDERQHKHHGLISCRLGWVRLGWVGLG